jgi:hypothetical protein
MFQTEVVEKIRTHIFMFNNSAPPSPEIVLFWGSVEKYGRARQAIVDIVLERIRIACWITKNARARTHSQNI